MYPALSVIVYNCILIIAFHFKTGLIPYVINLSQ